MKGSNGHTDKFKDAFDDEIISAFFFEKKFESEPLILDSAMLGCNMNDGVVVSMRISNDL